jgi:hypothetical protein
MSAEMTLVAILPRPTPEHPQLDFTGLSDERRTYLQNMLCAAAGLMAATLHDSANPPAETELRGELIRMRDELMQSIARHFPFEGTYQTGIAKTRIDESLYQIYIMRYLVDNPSRPARLRANPFN